MADQAGVVHEGILRSVVDTETEGVGAQLDTAQECGNRIFDTHILKREELR